jgi:hypothetical protein
MMRVLLRGRGLGKEASLIVDAIALIRDVPQLVCLIAHLRFVVNTVFSC